jgi:hypothetical protein
MKRFLLIVLCLLLTGCTYLGATEDILIQSPDEIEVSSFNPQDYDSPVTTTTEIPDTTDEPIVTTHTPETTAPMVTHLILNTSSKKIHYYDDCSYAKRMDTKNRKITDLSAEKSLLAEEYTVCSWCAKQRG